MATVFEISMSLDGYVTAAGARPEEPMGDGGQQLHEWAFGADERGREVLAESARNVGASIAGRRTYDLSVPWWGPDGRAAQLARRRSSCPTARPGKYPRKACTRL
jgi:hypothetical protein